MLIEDGYWLLAAIHFPTVTVTMFSIRLLA
jgi:hypothetical protein